MSQVVSFSLTDAQCQLLAKLGNEGSTSLICKEIIVQHLSSLSNTIDDDGKDMVECYIDKRFDGLKEQLLEYIASEVKAQVDHLSKASNIVQDGATVLSAIAPKRRGRPKKVT